jgi:hypothetical protein
VKLLIAIGVALLIAGCAGPDKTSGGPSGDPVANLEVNFKALESQSLKHSDDTIKIATETESLIEEMKKSGSDEQKQVLTYMGKKVAQGKKSLMENDGEMAKANFQDGSAVIDKLKPAKK